MKRIDPFVTLLASLILAVSALQVCACSPVRANGNSASSKDQDPPPAPGPNIQRLIAERKFAEAETALADILAKHPERAGAWIQLGVVRQSQAKYAAALEAYEKAATFPATKGVALYNQGCIHALQKDPEKAFAALQSAIAAGFVDREQFLTDTDLDSLRSDPRLAKLIPEVLMGAALFVEPTRILHSLTGETANDEFGWTARRVGDIDKDGISEYAVTAPEYRQHSGKVYVYSGRTAKLLFDFVGERGQRIGNIATQAGDIDADGVPDVYVGATGGAGMGLVLSGKTGKTLLRLHGSEPGTQFGYKGCGMGDIDGDGHDDIVLTALEGEGKAPKSGCCYGYSGTDGSLLFKIDGERSGDKFGSAISANPSKGGVWIAIGAQDGGEGQRGRVYIYRIEQRKPVLKHVLEAQASGRDFGQMFLSFPGDYDKDGNQDLYAADFNSSAKVPGGGSIAVFSPTTGKKLVQIDGQRPGEGLGTSPSDAGDCDGDGVGDLIVGAWQNNSAARSGGKVYLFSGATQKELASWTCRQPGDTFGFDAVGIGDVDGDGNIDFLLTSAWSPAKGPKTGRVFVIAGPKLKSK